MAAAFLFSTVPSGTPCRVPIFCEKGRKRSLCLALPRALFSHDTPKTTSISPQWLPPPNLLRSAFVAVLSFSLSFTGVGSAGARLEGVNKPELLPPYFTPVIDVAGFLSAGQEDRIVKQVADLEQDTGFKLRVLAQNYPDTPGLAIKDYWQVDDNTIVFVADPSLGGNILNFNVGAMVDLSVPRSFWTRLAGKYGNKFFWQEQGEDASIEAAVEAIGLCLREPAGPQACVNIE